MTNLEIIANEVVNLGLASVETVEKTLSQGKALPFMTYQEWRKHGYSVKKGEKALFRVRLWKKTDVKNDKGEKVGDKFVSPYCYIFGGNQVEKIGAKSSTSETRKEETPKEAKVEAKPRNSKKSKAKAKKEVKKVEAVATSKAQTRKMNQNRMATTKIFTEDGIKYIKYTAADGKQGFTMPYEAYEKLSKRTLKLYGIA